MLDEVLQEAEQIGAEARKHQQKPVLIGNDAHGGALSLARRAAVAAGVDNLITFTQGDARDITHPALDAAKVAEQERFRAKGGEGFNGDDVTNDGAMQFGNSNSYGKTVGRSYDHGAKYGDGFVNLDDLGPVTTRDGGGGVLVVSNPPWGKRLDVGGGRDRDGQRRSAKSWGSPNRSGDGYDGDGDGDGEGYDGGYDDDDDAAARTQKETKTTTETGSDSLDSFGEENDDSIESAWHSLGVFFRRECAGATAHLLSGDAGATRALRMRARRKRVLGIGGVDCRLLEYRILPPKIDKGLLELTDEARREEQEETNV